MQDVTREIDITNDICPMTYVRTRLALDKMTPGQTLLVRLKGQEPSKELRDYGVGAQILLDLGVRDMILLSNTQKNIVGLEGYGLTLVGQRAISA